MAARRTEGISSWPALVGLLHKLGLEDRLVYASPTAKVYARSTERVTDPQLDTLEGLFPTAYRAFVESHGYPMLLLPSAVRGGLAFLPPPSIVQVTGAMGVHESEGYDDLASAISARRDGSYEWRFAMFAGNDFADVDGLCFGKDYTGAPVVWLVEGGVPLEPAGTFEQWMAAWIRDVADALFSLDAEALQKVRSRAGDYEYAPSGLSSFG
jgi:hypothetical protein